MKLNIIKEIKDNKAGWCIRATVSFFGKYWFAPVKIVGKPLIEETRLSPKSWKINTVDYIRKGNNPNYCSYLGVPYPMTFVS